MLHYLCWFCPSVTDGAFSADDDAFPNPNRDGEHYDEIVVVRDYDCYLNLHCYLFALVVVENSFYSSFACSGTIF
jgi:hypothetical protein